MASTAFDYLLSPITLVENLPEISDPEALQLLNHFLGLLQTEKSKTTPIVQVREDGSSVPTPATTAEAGDDITELADNDDPPVIPPMAWKKMAVLQMLCLQLACKLEWNISTLHQHVPIALQHQVRSVNPIVTCCTLHLFLSLSSW